MQTSKIGRLNTTVTTQSDGAISLVLYKTEILRHWPINRKVRIDTGGFFTKLTRSRLSQAFNEWNIPLNASFRKDCNEIFNYNTGESFKFSKDNIVYVNY